MKSKHTIERLDTRPLLGDPSEVYCVMCIRDEMLRLPWVLEYHRNLGVNRFFVIDNASTDGSTDYLLGQPDVHLFFTRDSYGESSFGITWSNLILDHFCVGHWCVVIDADELLIYPHCEQLKIGTLCDYLNANGAQAVYTRMFDMYSDRLVSETHYTAGAPFQEACPFFDGDGYNTVQTPRLFPEYQIYGGIRKRVFWKGQSEESLPPVLTKLALVRWALGQKYLLSTHVMTPVALAKLSGALLHYKFLGDFHNQAIQSGKTETQYDRAREYSVYARLLESSQKISFNYEGSIKYKSSMQMVDLGFMESPKTFDKYLESHGYSFSE